MLQTWPQQVADSLSGEIHDVLTTTRGDVLTIGAVLAVYFASNGVEALRVALNRAYAVIEPRRWYWLRLESIGYTLVAAFTSLAMAFLIVLGPLITGGGAAPHSVLRRNQRKLPQRRPLRHHHRGADRRAVHPARLAAGGPPQFSADPARHRLHHGGVAACRASCSASIWRASPTTTSRCMPGLASVIIALVFLYFIAAIFVYGGELNAAIIKSRLPHGVSLQAAQSLAHADSQA